MKYVVPNKATVGYIPVVELQAIDPASTPAKAYVKLDRVKK